MDWFMQQLPKGFAGRNCAAPTARSIASSREGSVDIGATHLEFAPHDVFVVPSWNLTAAAAADCVISATPTGSPRKRSASGGKKVTHILHST